MKLEQRLQASISHRLGNVVLRSEVAGLGSASQVSVALNALQEKGIIARLGSGVYAKASKDPSSGKFVISDSLEALALEFFKKMGLPARVVPDRSISGKQARQVHISVSGRHRLRRKLSLAGRSITYIDGDEQTADQGMELVAHPKMQVRPRRTSVEQYIRRLAKRHNISYTRTHGDEWAEAVTSLAGDEVRFDPIKDLLQALSRAGKISNDDMVTLLIRYLREKKACSTHSRILKPKAISAIG